MQADHQLKRIDLDQLAGPAVIEFGADWCGYCQAAQALIAAALATSPGIKHIRIEDGKGKALGRSYSVKLWPTLVFLQDGVEVTRLVRPTDTAMISGALQQISAR